MLWRRIVPLFGIAAIAAAPVPAFAGIRVHPDGVNVNVNAATTVFLTFGGLTQQVAAEAFWCGELIPAAPHLGRRCDPATIFGRLPVQFDLATRSGSSGFTDIMTIPASVARRARQAAEAGSTSSFFYVRRFVSATGGPDEYVAVTCRLAGGGARVPFSLLDVRLRFAGDAPVLFVAPGGAMPAISAEIAFNGTGRLKGRWEVVMPGDEPPDARDLLTEAALPVEERSLQRRYTEVARFNVFLPPVGRYTLAGPDPSKLPTAIEGVYALLLRIEATDDKEGDSNLATAGSGTGVVHSGAVAGFPLPPLRYAVGSGSAPGGGERGTALSLLAPAAGVRVTAERAIDFSWSDVSGAVIYRLEIRTSSGAPALSALLQPPLTTYRAPAFLRDKAADGVLRWRVAALDADGRALAMSEWRRLDLVKPPVH